MLYNSRSGLSPISEQGIPASETTSLICKAPIEKHEDDTRTLATKIQCSGRFVKLVLYGALLVCLVELAFLLMTWGNPNEGDQSFRILPLDPNTGFPDIPLLGRSNKWKRHRAQTMADDYRDSYLLAIEPDSSGVVDLSDGVYDSAPDGCEGTVVIVRHCEKASIREHCSYIGYERSVFLATLFGSRNARWPKPSFIYAESPIGRNNPRKHNFREVETVLPLADKAGLTINSSFQSVSRLADDIIGKLASGEMCGKVAVVAWKHSGIVSLANKLGCGPSQGCPFDYPGQSFDEAWTIKFAYDKLWHSEQKSGKIPKYARWQVFGSVQTENFDPLNFSKEFGDYPKGGTRHGGRWRGQWANVNDPNTVDEDIETDEQDLGPPEEPKVLP